MLTGTPLDLTPLGPLLHAAALVYWGLALVLGVLLLRSKLKWFVKLPLALAVPVLFVWPVWRAVEESKTAAEAADARLALAMARFNERCKLSGMKIHRKVEPVDGIVWMKWRPKAMNLDDQYALDDPYGRDCGGEACILQLLRVAKGMERDPDLAKRHLGRFEFVESDDPSSGARFRYTASVASVRQRTPDQIEQYKRNSKGVDPGSDIWDIVLEREPIQSFTARYGVTWEDISTREDRDRWIAGGSLKVIDLHTGETVAEKVGFMVDRGQGSRAGFRSPWAMAIRHACPKLQPRPNGDPPQREFTEGRDFIFSAIGAVSGEKK